MVAKPQACTMKIDSLQLIDVPGERGNALLVQLNAAGASGFGEAAVETSPIDSDQWSGGTRAFIDMCLVPQLVDRDIATAGDLAEILARFRGHSLAKGAVDCAWHDLAARLAQRPLWQALGAVGREVDFARAYGPRSSLDALLAELAAAIETGLARVTLKLRPGWGIDVVRGVRGTFPDLAIRVDFDSTATLDQRDLLYRLQDYQVAAIEQPLDADDLVGHAMLQESLRTPICLDQSITSPERARLALDLGACQEIRIAPDLCGGLTAAQAIVAACREAAAACSIGSRALTEVGRRHAAALAMLSRVAAPVELDDNNEPPTANAPQHFGIAPWPEPGIGAKPHFPES